jgi:esterase/lipase superfamily enzyme
MEAAPEPKGIDFSTVSVPGPGGGAGGTGAVPPQPAATEPASKDFTEVPVYYATDRKRDPAATTEMRFGKERNPEGDHLGYGRAVITIPKHHRVGTIERPQWWKFEFREDPKRHVVMMEPEVMTREVFYQEMRAAASGAPQKELLLFVHGFNVEYAAAMRRTGQIVYDLGFGGVAMCYSWPSQGDFTAYPVDRQNADWTVPHLVKVLQELQQVESFEKVHVIAHSMGTHVLTRALSEITDPAFQLKLNNVILAAPDIDADIFREQILPKIRGKAQRLTMYASSGDTALNLSTKFNGSRRLGLSGDGLVVVPELMDTVDASQIDTSLIGHSYYGSQKVVVEDLFKLVMKGLLPEQRSLKHGVLGQWELPLPAPDPAAPPTTPNP